MEIKFKEHKAAVRAVEFSRHQNNILISGGGSKDQTICVWNTSSHEL
jgi:cell division cycle 20-like protein 1 (cofactor of APC complex)